MPGLIHDPFYGNQRELILVYQNILLDAANIVIDVALSSTPPLPPHPPEFTS